MKPLVSALVAAWLATSAGAQEGRIVVLGDSVMDWNAEDGAAIADVIGGALGREVENLSVSGARFTNERWGARLTGMDIRAQFDFEPADWVVLTGGANDLGDECGCGDCAETLGEMIVTDGRTGDIPDFVTEVRETGARLLWVLYYDSPEGPDTEFAACTDEFAELDVRLSRLAAGVPGMHIADAGRVIDPGNPRHYDPDRVHPSAEGSRLIGLLAADLIAATP